jgi:3-isopropylmalate/(R)-2-methylmalate dehydratase large subunit
MNKKKMGHTFVEKVLIQHTRNKNLKPGDIVTIEPDRVMSHDNTAFIIKKFEQTGATKVWNKEKIVIIFDHCVPAEKPAYIQNHSEATAFANEQELPHFFGATAGVSHQVMMEKGFVLPGQINLGADSHSTLYGAMGNLGIPINRTEMAGIWATGKIWLKVPHTIKIVLDGELQSGVYAKDIVLHTLKILRADGATYKVIEWCGPTIHNMSMASRMTLSNMSVELGAKAGVMPFDDITKAYLDKRTNEQYEPVFADEDAYYERIININVSELEPQVACPHTVDNVKSISDVDDINIDQAYLGSCTNGRIEDLQVAAEILRGKKIAEHVTLNVYPASKEIMDQAEDLGILQTLKDAGAHIKTASCGPCFGAVGATLEDDQICISSSNRNFCGRMGSKKSFVYLGSPAMVAASCITGKIADPREHINRSDG